LGALHGMTMWEAFHLPYMPPNFRHWRDRIDDML
jgi:hypothetical protein